MTTPPNLSADAVLIFALLHALADMRIELGLDADGSGAFEATETALGHWAQLSTATPDAPKHWPSGNPAALSEARDRLRKTRAIAHRLVLAARAMQEG